MTNFWYHCALYKKIETKGKRGVELDHKFTPRIQRKLEEAKKCAVLRLFIRLRKKKICSCVQEFPENLRFPNFPSKVNFSRTDLISGKQIAKLKTQDQIAFI